MPNTMPTLCVEALLPIATKEAFQAYASEHALLLGEVLEFALDALVQSKKSKG